MLRRWLLYITLLTLPVYAGSYEDAVHKGGKVFLYLYTKDCKSCAQFNPLYNELSKTYNDYIFVKEDVHTPYGYKLLLKFRGRYVPYVILTNAKTGRSVQIPHYCLMDTICRVRAIKSFE